MPTLFSCCYYFGKRNNKITEYIKKEENPLDFYIEKYLYNMGPPFVGSVGYAVALDQVLRVVLLSFCQVFNISMC